MGFVLLLTGVSFGLEGFCRVWRRVWGVMLSGLVEMMLKRVP